MESKERVEIIERMASALERLVGAAVEISEPISRDENREFDRHCSINNRFQFIVERVGWQMSGGHFYLYGALSQYGIQTDQVISFLAATNELIITEKYETKTIRQTKILFGA